MEFINQIENTYIKHDGDLTMICSKSEMYIDGLIHNNNNIVVLGLNEVKKFNVNNDNIVDLKNLSIIKNNDFENLKAYLMVDGTIIKCFWHNDMWRKSTNKIIDAYKCRWENKKSFGEMFDELSNDINFENFDKKLVYYFIIQHPENRIIQKIETGKLYFIGAYDILGNEIKTEIDNVHYQQKVNFVKLEDIIKFLKAGNLQWEIPGIILCSSNIKNRIFFENPNYKKIQKTKNSMKFNTKNWIIKENVNQSSCRFVKIIIENKEEEFFKYFPEHKNDLIFIKQQINNLINEVFNIYQKCHVDKIDRYNDTHKYFNFLQKVHKEYLQTRRRITRDKVKELFYNQSITFILSILELIDLK